MVRDAGTGQSSPTDVDASGNPAARPVPASRLIRVVIADDEEASRNRLRRLLAAIENVRVIAECEDGASALDTSRRLVPDVIFLDVEMPGRNGLDVAQALLSLTPPPLIVFATAFDQYAIRAFEVSAIDYVLKPVSALRLAETWARVQLRFSTEDTQAQRILDALESLRQLAVTGDSERKEFRARFMVTVNDRTTIVPAADVRWIEAAGNYVHLHTGSGKPLIRESVAVLAEQLDPATFIRIHRRLIVNVSCVREIQPWFSGDAIVLLHTGEKLRMSRSFRGAFAARLQGIPLRGPREPEDLDGDEGDFGTIE